MNMKVISPGKSHGLTTGSENHSGAIGRISQEAKMMGARWN